MRLRTILAVSVVTVLLLTEPASARFRRARCAAPCVKVDWVLYTCDNGEWTRRLQGSDWCGLARYAQTHFNAVYVLPPPKWIVGGVCYAPHLPPPGNNPKVFTITLGKRLSRCKCGPVPVGACPMPDCMTPLSRDQEDDTDCYMYRCKDGLNWSICVQGPSCEDVKKFANENCDCDTGGEHYCYLASDGGAQNGKPCGGYGCPPCVAIPVGCCRRPCGYR